MTTIFEAIERKDDALIDFLLNKKEFDWSARNSNNETLLMKAVQSRNTSLVQRLLSEPHFAHTLQNYKDEEKFALLREAILNNDTSIVPLLCEKFPDALCQRDQHDLTPLHYMGKRKADPYRGDDAFIQIFTIVSLLSRPGIEHSLETNNLAKILFDSAEKPSFSPIIPVILRHYLHNSTLENNEATQHSLENYLVQIFAQYNSQDNLGIQSADQYQAIAAAFFYYQKKFIRLDSLYKKLLQRADFKTLHVHKFIRSFQLFLKQRIVEYETHKLIQIRFHLKDLCVEPNVLQLATELWYHWKFEEKCKLLYCAYSYRLLINNEQAQESFFQDNTKIPTQISLKDRIMDLPLELRKLIIDACLEKFDTTKYAGPEMHNTIIFTASTALIPHTPEQQNQAFYLLLRGINFRHHNPSIFTAEQVDGKTRLVRTSKTLTKKALKKALKEESNTINAYLQEETARQLQVFNSPEKSF